MKDIYTKTGDNGMTSLRNGIRVEKDDIRIETNGQIDHLNSLLGIVRACLGPDCPPLLHAIQRELMVVMSHIATPDGQQNAKPLHADELTAQMEQSIDELRAGQPTAFVVPGDSLTASFIHAARTQARTVERRLWTLNKLHPVSSPILVMMNRLSDYLFTLALQKPTQP